MGPLLLVVSQAFQVAVRLVVGSQVVDSQVEVHPRPQAAFLASLAVVHLAAVSQVAAFRAVVHPHLLASQAFQVVVRLAVVSQVAVHPVVAFQVVRRQHLLQSLHELVSYFV